MEQQRRIAEQSTEAVVFDFDLTLADAVAGATDSINWALQQMGHPAIDVEPIRRTIGMSLDETLRQLTGVTDPAAAARFRRLFAQRADLVVAGKTWLYPPVPAAVATLRAAGLKLAIVSNKFRYRIEQILEREGLLGHFEVILGSEDIDAPKPDPAGLLAAMTRLGVRREKVLYVGDSVVDAETACRAEVAFVAVLTGPTRREEFASYPLAGVLEHVGKVPALLGLEGSSPPESSRLRQEAEEIIQRLKLLEILITFGQCGVKGSVALDLVVKRDIDLYLLVETDDLLSPVDSVYHQLLGRDGIREVRITDYRKIGGLKIGIDDYRGPSGSWSIDIWVTNQAETTGAVHVRRLRTALQPEHRQAILRIKAAWHERGLLRDGMSVRIYEAVVDQGVRTREEFERYLTREGPLPA